jgi:hypothetical protein
MTMYGSQTILESSQAPPPNNCLRSVHCHYRSLYLIYYYVTKNLDENDQKYTNLLNNQVPTRISQQRFLVCRIFLHTYSDFFFINEP